MPEFLSKVQLYKMHGRSPIWSIASSLLSFFELRESIKSSHNKFALHLYRNACMHAQSLPLCLTLWNLRTVAHQTPLSMGFSRREYWSELPCPPPGDLPDPGIESVSPGLQADSFHLLSSIHREWAELSLSCPKRENKMIGYQYRKEWWNVSICPEWPGFYLLF